MNFTAVFDAETARYLRTIHPSMKFCYNPELNNMYADMSKYSVGVIMDYDG